MSDDASACPECDATQILYCVGNGKDGNPKIDERHICTRCGHRFDDPKTRENRTQGHDRKGLAKTLTEMDPDDLGGGVA